MPKRAMPARFRFDPFLSSQANVSRSLWPTAVIAAVYPRTREARDAVNPSAAHE
jgi:hypothetical protein